MPGGMSIPRQAGSQVSTIDNGCSGIECGAVGPIVAGPSVGGVGVKFR